MQPFEYVQPKSLGEAAAAARRQNARFIAGGTNLVDLMKLGVEQPDVLVDITSLPLDAIEASATGLRLGALARNSTVAHHPAVRDGYPVLSQALLAGASPQLRNMATVGGNLLQRTRCFYFNDTAFPCNKRNPGTGCSAMDGYNRIHAIFGTSPQCIATHPSDMTVALTALDASVRILSTAGERSVPLADFYREPGDTPERDTNLQPGDLILGVDVPASPAAKQSLYVKVRDRASYEFALVSVAAALSVEDGRVRQARLAFGGVGTKPWRSSAAEAVLQGATLGEAAYTDAADAAVGGAQTRDFNAYKVDLLRRTVRRTLAQLGEKV